MDTINLWQVAFGAVIGYVPLVLVLALALPRVLGRGRLPGRALSMTRSGLALVGLGVLAQIAYRPFLIERTIGQAMTDAADESQPILSFSLIFSLLIVAGIGFLAAAVFADRPASPGQRPERTAITGGDDAMKILTPRQLMVGSSIALFVAAAACLFLPEELAAAFGLGPGAGLGIQLAGPLYLGFAAANWTARGSMIGGIYARPLSLGNFAHFFAGAATMLGALELGAPHPLRIGVTLVYVLFATAFMLLVFGKLSRGEAGSGG